MKTLILNGSPRRDGNTAFLIRKLAGGLPGECRVVNAYEENIAPCTDCRYCREHPGCAIRDGMQEVYAYLEDCDCVVIASPVYFGELTGRLLDVASRLQTYFSAWYFRREAVRLKEKRGAVILTGGGSGGIERAYQTACFLLRQMNVRQDAPLAAARHTDETEAAGDPEALAAVGELLGYLAGEKA